MDPSEIAAMVAAFVIVGVPVLGITARLVVRPIVDALVRLQEAGLMGTSQQQQLEQRQIVELQEEVQTLRRAVERLTEAESFNRQLGAGETRSEPPRPTSG